MQVDIDHYTTSGSFGTESNGENNGENNGESAVLRMFGVTREGVSVMAHVHGYMPYMYCPKPQG